ncbi:MAG: ROK family protein [Candidatus Yonathbacteria bacterium]|nr:ROK family protein [Candidatus Yonathbacteria bacterium]
MFILFDIGGTKMRVVAADYEKLLGEPVVVSTPKDFNEGIDTLKRIIDNIAQGLAVENRAVTAIVGGVAGPLDGDKTMLVRSPNLSGWVGHDIKNALHNTYKVPVNLENDSALVGLGEAHFGAGRGKAIVVYLTVSTGVGGARIVDGKIDRASLGFEPGHQIIDPDNTLCPRCEGNDLEAYVSGTSIEKRFGVKPYEIHDDAVWDELAKFLAYGLNNTIVHWSPDIVVIGGSMMKEVGIPVPAIRKHLAEIMKIFPNIPPIEKAELGDFGGLYGSLAYARMHY